MGMDRDDFTEINKSFDQFIKELQKQPIPENKIVELSNIFHKAIRKKFNQLNDEKNDQIIPLINLNLLKRERKIFAKSNLQNKARIWTEVLLLSSVGILFITIGFILIITPASAEFEIATIFYFNENDGLTVMDMFALVLIFAGIFFFIRAFIEREKT